MLRVKQRLLPSLWQRQEMYSGLQYICSCRFCVLPTVCRSMFETPGYVLPWGTAAFVLGKLEKLGLQERKERRSHSQVMVSAILVSANMMAQVLFIPVPAVALV